ncbi:hypothetical protein RFI_18274 [Reticulomyxa filosa]|uniref:Ubiquitin-like domain-containing protein n=1 Tax=Reticulomyxa filosa TaxID=46433 RepID=X6MMJ5_RETFI|nr:hypothetical protein RFI_23066 [Reticulomyxa filosa]ETO18966.1 hypothetical protein RFI_18274 [Reticulomyxa filosa]|eukprot:ETO14300.1 hypothetical protein RFI_23066 [Reticulomyxa filosa]
MTSERTIESLSKELEAQSGIRMEDQLLLCNRLILSEEQHKQKTLKDLNIDTTESINVELNVRIKGGRLHGQVLQKTLLYLRPRGYAGLKEEKMHCLMMAKLVNTKQIHLLVLIHYFYARIALISNRTEFVGSVHARMRGLEMQKRSFLFPRH